MATRLIILVSLCAVAITSMAQSVISGKVSNAEGSCVDFIIRKTKCYWTSKRSDTKFKTKCAFEYHPTTPGNRDVG